MTRDVSRTGREKKMTPKQIRARARRNGGMENLSQGEKLAMLKKPIEEWDLEELAAGRPKNKNGGFSGAPPAWVTRDIHEKSIEIFKERMRSDMRSVTVKAMDVLANLLDDDEVDDKGKPLVPASTKADVAKFLIEHLLGKATQPVEMDISVKLQGILGAVLVQPDELTGEMVPASSHRVLEGTVVDEDEEPEDVS